MLDKDPKIETTSTLDADNTFTSDTEESYAPGDYVSYILGTVYADQPGLLKIQFDDGSGNWDGGNDWTYKAGSKMGFRHPIVAPYFRVVFENADVAQSTFRLKVWEGF